MGRKEAGMVLQRAVSRSNGMELTKGEFKQSISKTLVLRCTIRIHCDGN